MDGYFMLCIVAFLLVGIGMIIFAFQGPACNDNNDSQFDEIISPIRIPKEEQERRPNQLNQPQTTCLFVPVPPANSVRELTPPFASSSSLNPPPLGFNSNILSGPETSGKGKKTYPYPQDEELSRMPFPTPVSSHASASIDGNRDRQPSEPQISSPSPRTARYSSVRVSGTSHIPNEPPPPYSEVDHHQPSARNRRNRFKKRLSQ